MTTRISVPALDAYLDTPIAVLDHGFVRLVDYMGDDTSIVQAARVSYGKGTKAVQQDRGLIRYLMRHDHLTPFEMCEIKFHIKLPIFIARQWIRHRTANVNERSARYSVVEDDFFLPEAINTQSTTNHQGRSDTSIESIEKIRKIMTEDATRCYEHYMDMMTDDNVARELARINLPINYYTEWYWKVDLRNLFNFLRLRADPHAQKEIRDYTEAIMKIVKVWVPMAYEAFEEYALYAKRLSKTQAQVIQDLLDGNPVTQATSGLPKREWTELTEIFTCINKNEQ